MTAQAEDIPQRGRPASRRFARPTVGPGPAAKKVAEDASALIRAEIELAKAEISAAAKEKVTGVAFLAVTAVLAWLGLQGLLITAGFALALVLPGWAAALIVSAVLLLIAGILALVGRRKLQSPISVETTKANVEEDVAWTKAHLSKQ